MTKIARIHFNLLFVYRCVGHVIQVVIGGLLGEMAQVAACKELIHIISKFTIKTIDPTQLLQGTTTNLRTIRPWLPWQTFEFLPTGVATWL